tara:strand:+ start:416 stop:823 length:408 start_codon:yes stop_codon:yes gene_type:complete
MSQERDQMISEIDGSEKKDFDSIVTRKYRLTNIDPKKSFADVEDFFNHSSSIVVEPAIIETHIKNDEDHGVIKSAEMDADMKSVIIVREFKDEKVYKSWLEHAEKLEDIDDQVTEQSMDVEPNWAYRFDNGDFKR